MTTGSVIDFETRAENIEDARIPVSATNFLEFFGVGGAKLPAVTVDSALTVPAVLAAVTFLSRTLASLPRDVKRWTPDGEERVAGAIQELVHDYPNPEMDAFKFWQYFWQQVFTGGRGMAWIERSGRNVVNLWPIDPYRTTVARLGGKLIYRFEDKVYPAADVIDIPFMLRHDMVLAFGPIHRAARAIQLAIAMNDYGSQFFASGGVPPLALKGALPSGPEAIKRAQMDIRLTVDAAKNNGEQIFPIPAGYELVQVGYDPSKGQMVEARLFQIQEIARAWQMPPNFLQDLSKATFANVEQGDLYLVKHLIGQWTKALEGEMSLKIFGRGSNRYVEHDLDGLMRGDLLSRMDALSKGVQTGQITPNEARAANARPKHKNPAADELFIQSGTVVLSETAPNETPAANPADPATAAPNGEANVGQD